MRAWSCGWCASVQDGRRDNTITELFSSVSPDALTQPVGAGLTASVLYFTLQVRGAGETPRAQ